MANTREKRQNKYSGWKIQRDKKPPFRWRAYHRKTGEKIDCQKFEVYSLAFDMEVHRLNQLHTEQEAKPGTLGMLIKKYRASPDFIDGEVGKSPRTRADYQRVFNYLQAIEDTPLVWFTQARVVKIRDKAFVKLKRKWANYVVTVLSIIFKWGRLRGYIEDNPAAEIPAIPRPKSMLDANRPWQDAERESVMIALPAHMKLPMALMMYCAIDPSDAVKLPRTAVKDGMLDTRRGKTGVPVWIPLPAPLIEVMETAPEHNAITLCANSRGKPWTYSGYSSNWDKLKDTYLEQGIIQPGLTLKGLRHTVASILAELGFNDRTIADMLGQESEAMARRYSKRANRTRKMQGVIADFEQEVNRRKTEVVKPGK